MAWQTTIKRKEKKSKPKHRIEHNRIEWNEMKCKQRKAKQSKKREIRPLTYLSLCNLAWSHSTPLHNTNKNTNKNTNANANANANANTLFYSTQLTLALRSPAWRRSAGQTLYGGEGTPSSHREGPHICVVYSMDGDSDTTMTRHGTARRLGLGIVRIEYRI